MTLGRIVSRGLRACAHPSLLFGMVIGSGVTFGALQGPYINWHTMVSPVDEQPLMIRHDAKGDGHFASPRSGRRRHRGVDLVAELNSPVHAIRSGSVVQVGTHRGLGRFVELEHEHDLHSLYAHLNEVRVDAGAKVRQGDVIGTVGKTGNARHPSITPHLHLEVLRGGVPIDPLTVGLRAVDMPRSGGERDALVKDLTESVDASEDE